MKAFQAASKYLYAGLAETGIDDTDFRILEALLNKGPQLPDVHYIWFWRKRFPEQKGQRCKVLVRGKMNSCLVEFEDGFRVVTSRFAVRREKKGDSKPQGELFRKG